MLLKNKRTLVMLEIIMNYIFLTLKVTVKSRSSYSRFFCNVRYAYFFVFVRVHQLEKSLNDIMPCVFFWRIFHDTVSVWAGHAADNTQTSNVYTHFSREFLKREGEKVNYII